jgi:hypothetical protein
MGIFALHGKDQKVLTRRMPGKIFSEGKRMVFLGKSSRKQFYKKKKLEVIMVEIIISLIT